jgi:hypothetical protein
MKLLLDMMAALKQTESELSSGAILTFKTNRIRLRMLPFTDK